MSIEAQFIQDGEMVDWTADADVVGGQVIQLRDGRAGVVSVDAKSGTVVGVYISGIFKCLKTASMVMLPSSKAFWDHSANKVHLLHGGDRDFFMGTVTEDAASADTTVLVNLNVQPVYTVGLEQGWVGVRVQTAGFVSSVGSGREGWAGQLDATAEAQKADALSLRKMLASLTGAKGIGHALICINDGGNNAALDINIGIANATHASDADSITEHLLLHIDGNSTNINLQSKDGTTTVAATDTTVDYTVGTPFLFQFDMRNPADVQCYIDGVLVLAATVFDISAAAGPWKFLAHAEKSANATPGNVTVGYGGVCPAQV